MFEVLPAPLLGVLTLRTEIRDIIFSIDSYLVIRLLKLSRDGLIETVVYDCNQELPYGMKPRLKSVVYCGNLGGQNVFLLFENYIYMIVDINEGNVVSFTVSDV